MASFSILLCSAGMASHPPVPISEMADHIERLKANDNLKFSQEYEVGMLFISPWKSLTWEVHLVLMLSHIFIFESSFLFFCSVSISMAGDVDSASHSFCQLSCILVRLRTIQDEADFPLPLSLPPCCYLYKCNSEIEIASSERVCLQPDGYQALIFNPWWRKRR